MAPFSGQEVHPAHVEKLAIVAAFTGQDHRCVRGPRGKIRDSGPLTHSLHRKNITETFFFCFSPCLPGAGVPAGFPAGFLPLSARWQTHTKLYPSLPDPKGTVAVRAFGPMDKKHRKI